ncbi:hypothetical protein INT45_001452 [Circinella minor]|uniref:Uncharacterized protein n=1 Tax=Circinella minor TaxID=1195481 RepID=A0A8H7RK60_9FUNG|nr:hypothetical protein INT45_001452 [Circinella minor]
MNPTTPNTTNTTTIASEATTSSTTTTTTTATTTTVPTADASAQRPHGKNFERKEDLQLVNAYLVTSKDSEMGTDQSSDKFWTRVWSKFIEDGNEKDCDFNAL